MPSTTLPDELADALGRVVADVQRQARKDLDLFVAKSEALAAKYELRIHELEAQVKTFLAGEGERVSAAIAAIKPGDPGKSLTSEDVRPLIDDLVANAIAALPLAPAGKDADPVVTAALVALEVERAVSALPKPENGKSIAIEDVRPILAEMVAALPPAPAGKDADLDIIQLMVMEEVAKIPPAPAGKDADPEVIERLVKETVSNLPPAPAGKDADLAIVRLMVAEEVAKIPAATNGKDADPKLIERLVNEAVAKVPPAPAGKDADPKEVAALVIAEVERAVAALPKPENGKSISAQDVEPLIQGLVSKTVSALPVPKDGVGLAGAIIGRDGDLVLTLTDGSTKSLGVVVGRDADQVALSKQVDDLVAKFPKPKDGTDGLGFDDLNVEHDGERTVILRFARGDQVKEFKIEFPTPIDRGVWREGLFKRGDSVSYGGSTFIAQCDTSAKPEASPDWRLAIKRGQNGSSAYDLARKSGFRGNEIEWLKSLRGEPGKKGDAGQDLTQLGPDGKKWR